LWQVKPPIAFEPTAPVMAGGMVFFSGDDGIVRALDVVTGKSKWRAYTGAAVRFPPTIAGALALVASGDGYVYAFEAATGKQRWRFRAAPQARMIPIYGKLQSTWPDAPVYDRSVVWPRMAVATANADLAFFTPKTSRRGVWTIRATPPSGGADAAGGLLWEQALPAAPVRWGIAMDASRVIVACRNGRIVCFGTKTMQR